jgi:hypothetical protein
MFIRNKKAMSFQMTRQKLKGRNSRIPTNHPDFYPLVATVNLENDQSQDRRSLTGGLQSDLRMLQASTTTEEIDAGNDDEEKLSHLVMRDECQRRRAIVDAQKVTFDFRCQRRFDPEECQAVATFL